MPLRAADSYWVTNPFFYGRYITCNINKDICITSEKDRAVLIYDNHLTEKYKIHNPYQDHRQNEIFCPRGICHDSFGRLIVADANNHAVLRVSVGEDYLTSEPQIILQNGVNGLEDFFFPTLVAMGPGDKLWVVCRNNIHVFNYMEWIHFITAPVLDPLQRQTGGDCILCHKLKRSDHFEIGVLSDWRPPPSNMKQS